MDALSSEKGTVVSTWSGRRLVQHTSCRNEIGGLEAFGEPGIGLSELCERILHMLPDSKPRQRHLGSQPPGQ